jgi:DNA polymerase-3 subunit gamma/tau
MSGVSDGSPSNAMSLLDQVIAFSGAKITAEDVTRVLGVADRRVMNDLTGAVLSGDAGKALEVLDAVARQGMDLVHLSRDLLRHTRNLVVAKVCNETQARELLDLADEEVADVLGLGRAHDVDDLTRVFTGLSRNFDEIVKSGQVRASLEMTLVRLAKRPALLPLDELLVRLGDLEKRLATGAPPPTRGGPSGGGGGSSRSREPSHASVTSAMPAILEMTPRPSAVGPPVASAGSRSPSSPPPGPGQTSGALALAAEPATPPPTSVVAKTDHDRATVEETWRAIIALIKAHRPSVAASLELAVPIVVTKERLVVGFEHDSFEDARAEQTAAQEVLTEHARAYFGAPTTITFEIAAAGAKATASVAYLDQAKRKQREAEARAAVANNELVKKVISLFGAELRDVKVPPQED